MPIAKIRDWELNTKVNAEFVKRSVDTQHLKIGTTAGNVMVMGAIKFSGSKIDESIDAEVINVLKSTDRAIRGITGVKEVKYQLSNWARQGGNWNRKAKEAA
jgi:hypothetical protein